MRSHLLVCAFVFAACHEEDVARPAADALVIEAHAGPSGVEVTARDAAGEQVAALILAVSSTGRSLTVDVGGRQLEHESTGLEPLRLPLLQGPAGDDFNGFLSDPRVAAALAPWGVAFAADAFAERARSADTDHTCAPRNPGCQKVQDPALCCDFISSTYPGLHEEYVCCPDAASGRTFVDRLCTGNPFGHNACGNTGMFGCAVCWVVAAPDFCEVEPSHKAPGCKYEYQ